MSMDVSLDAGLLAARGALEFRPGGVLAVGRETVTYDPRHIESLLSAHVQLIARLRPQQREASMVLRRDDITSLADLLGESTSEVIEKLGSLMGATRAQRSAMASMFAAGALVIGLAAGGTVFSRGASHAASIDLPMRGVSIEHLGEAAADAGTASAWSAEVGTASSSATANRVADWIKFGGEAQAGTAQRGSAAGGTVDIGVAPVPFPASTPIADATGTAASASAGSGSAGSAAAVAPTRTVGATPSAAPAPAMAPDVPVVDPSLVDIGAPPLPNPSEAPVGPSIGGPADVDPTLVDIGTAPVPDPSSAPQAD